MSNPEHLKVLKEGKMPFLHWRLQNPMEYPDLSGADLDGMDLRWYYLRFANMEKANLDNANLASSDLTCALLNGASLRNVCLHDARLRSTRLDEADLSGAKLYATELIDLELASTKNLLEMRILGPCSIDICTLYNSGGLLPDKFLRDCGIPDSLIGVLPNIIKKPERHFSCFMSYNENDDNFASKLYESLHCSDIFCWRWRDDATMGESLRKEIDCAIKNNDKLIVILSQNSLKSLPVIREMQRALQKEERDHNKGHATSVLFPIRIDGSIFQWEHEIKADVMEKTIGDFSGWHEQSQYDSAFSRLLSALRKDVLVENPGRWYPCQSA